MSARVCICCGQPLNKKGTPLSRNPHICASCSSLLDGMEEPATLQPNSERNSERTGSATGVAPRLKRKAA